MSSEARFHNATLDLIDCPHMVTSCAPERPCNRCHRRNRDREARGLLNESMGDEWSEAARRELQATQRLTRLKKSRAEGNSPP